MTVQDLEALYDYNYWANRKLFEVMSQLKPEEFTRSVAGSYGSVRNTLVHVMSAEWGWLDRCGGHPRGARLKSEDYPTLESLTTAWAKIESYVDEFLSALKDEDLKREVQYSPDGVAKRTMAIGDMLEHSVVHGAHHRGQVALLLRLLGYTPGNFDLIFYNAEKRGSAAW
jgi:uncharacterized damage-inducible protein DinB